MTTNTRIVLAFVALALLLAGSGARASTPLYYCVAPPMVCSSLSLLTSLQYRLGHLVADGIDYGPGAGSVYAVPNSVVVADKIFANGFGT